MELSSTADRQRKRFLSNNDISRGWLLQQVAGLFYFHMSFELREHQKAALKKMKNGCILNGSVGSGKSLTSLYYYYVKVCGGNIETFRMQKPRDLYIITTATKRDKKEWPLECAEFGLHEGDNDMYDVKVVIDSWNNIGKYRNVKDAFFIFDEQRVVGSGVWSRAFIYISRHNQWILLSATPGDNFMDYCSVFIANGFYKNRTDFISQHVIYKPYVKYRAIDRYVNLKKLYFLRDEILVPMEFDRDVEKHHYEVLAPYDKDIYKSLVRDRWNVYENRPIINASELCYLLRRVTNADPGRIAVVGELIAQHPKVIIFYNFTYEAETLIELCKGLGVPCARWDGVKHEPIPKGDRWVYILQYAAGDSGWNCIETDTIIFYSQNYSYKSTVQAAGRIDRMNTPFKNLYYYHVRSKAPIDLAIHRALKQKKKFNEKAYFKNF